MAEAVIVEAVRSPIGKRNGGLSGVHPGELSAQVLKGLAAYLWVGGERGHHESEARLAIGIGDAIVLRSEDLRPAGDCADSQFERHIDLIAFGERETLDFLFAFPHPL